MNWTEEQMRAIREEGQNIIVSAGAGSGKTAVLSERVLRKVKEKTSIDRLLILTFTHAAAKEMKDRIRKKLLAENLNQEVEKLDRAYITTFDSFALNLVKKYHMAFNISDHIKISDAIFIEFKEEKILDDILEEFYDQEEESFFKFIQTFCVKDDQILKKNILNLYHKLLLRYDLSTYLNTYMDTYYSDSYINQIITEYFLLIEKKKEKIETLFEKLKASLDQKEIEKYKDLSSFLQEKSYEKMKAQIEISLPRVNKNYGEYEKKIKEEIHSLLKEMKEYFIYENEEQIKTELLSTKENMEILISILKKLHQKVEQVKKEEELYTFIDIFKMAIQLVEEHSDIREQLMNQFDEIMIDEYQDNNDLQELFIEKISHNNVYMVGDIKQSIYRFRNANPNIFKQKYESFQNHLGGIKIDLNQNFRSRQEVLDDINLLFNQLMNLEIGGANYKESHQMIFGNKMYIQEGKTEKNYQLEIKKYPVDLKGNKEEKEIFLIADDINQKIKEQYPIFDRDLKKVRPIQYSDICILLDKSKNTTPLLI